MGLRETGGQLVTIEYDPGRAKELAENVKRAGFADIVTVIPGDAFKHLPTTSGAFDFVFLDAWKKDYKRFLDLMLPRLNKGGLFVAHNVVNKRSEMGDFLDAIWKNPALLTTIVSPSWATSMRGGSCRVSEPLGPFTVMTRPSSATSTPLGTVMGRRPIRDMPPTRCTRGSRRRAGPAWPGSRS